ncbi:TerB family tellurite resistance protein [Pelagibacteraceae bacterium]|nr:TerB family tellurite resistance protein [Pelagibacteraceae bacterium]MDC0412684.1 TerB family tellurite resistance protein [Pelagibacteraceae bacterium]|tara:strand:- start:2841 stop:3266 length:426 start_codon:yes stop_codon:yes gene_type:complete
MSWFSKNKQDANSKPLETSVTTLLIHAAKLDENYSQDEKITINKCLVELGFGEKDEVEKLIDRCEVLEKESNQILHLTQEIKKLKYADRLKIIEVLVQVVYADGKMDEFEDNLIRRVCGLVYVENADVGPIKENIKKKLTL